MASSEVRTRRQTWLLHALHSAGAKGLTPVQVQKALFLLERRRPDSVKGGFYRFRPYHYGPFDADVYRDAEELARDNLSVISTSSTGRTRVYQITPDGTAKAECDAAQLDDAGRKYLMDVVAWAQSVSFAELVSAVYAAYPETRVKSIFGDAGALEPTPE